MVEGADHLGRMDGGGFGGGGVIQDPGLYPEDMTPPEREDVGPTGPTPTPPTDDVKTPPPPEPSSEEPPQAGPGIPKRSFPKTKLVP